jgi:hypothetical protein
MTNRIHNFESFISLNEAKSDGTYIIIGDSCTPNIFKRSKTLTMLGNTGSEETLWKSGMGVKWLKTAVSKYPVSTNVKYVVINIGTNGAFSPNDDIKGLMVELRRVFPQAKFCVVQGSWGWGNNVSVTDNKVKTYYDRFKAEGVTVIEPPIGKVADPHTNLPVYDTIAKEIDGLVTNRSGYIAPTDLSKGTSATSQIISRPGDPYKYKVETDHWLAKKDSQSRWYEITGADFKPAYQVSIDILDNENPNMRSKNAPKKKGSSGSGTGIETSSVVTTNSDAADELEPLLIGKLPMKLTGSYKVPKMAIAKGDALHAFDRRKLDGFGGYMLRGGPIPNRWKSSVKLDQGRGINQVLEQLIAAGVKPDVTSIKVKVNDDYSVNWEATIDESKDGKAYAGLSTRGSAGENADQRALDQIPKMKSKKPNASDWKQVLDLNIDSPIKIRQYFFKYTDSSGLSNLASK